MSGDRFKDHLGSEILTDFLQFSCHKLLGMQQYNRQVCLQTHFLIDFLLFGNLVWSCALYIHAIISEVMNAYNPTSWHRPQFSRYDLYFFSKKSVICIWISHVFSNIDTWPKRMCSGFRRPQLLPSMWVSLCLWIRFSGTS
jgi:hypothetical protein